jgi:hypothetical protein
MAIYKLIRNTVFEPKDIERLVAAYEQTLRALRLKDRDDPITQLVAEKIIAIGRLGIEDPAEISKLTLKELGWVRRSSSRAASPAHLRALDSHQQASPKRGRPRRYQRRGRPDRNAHPLRRTFAAAIKRPFRSCCRAGSSGSKSRPCPTSAIPWSGRRDLVQ